MRNEFAGRLRKVSKIVVTNSHPRKLKKSFLCIEMPAKNPFSVLFFGDFLLKRLGLQVCPFREVRRSVDF